MTKPHRRTSQKKMVGIGHKYIIIYRFSKQYQYYWVGFDYLDQIKREYYYVIKGATNFKILINKNGHYVTGKYATLLNKKRFLELIQEKLVKAIMDSPHKNLIVKNMQNFSKYIENSLRKT